MRTFDALYAIAADRKGGVDALEDMIPLPDPTVVDMPEDRWLATLTKCVFQAGFNWKVIRY